jgi:heterodisulfide reductase subunit B
MVNQIVQNAMDSGAECIVTACAMCHLNLEIRCTLKKKVPIFHFSEILALAFQIKPKTDWFTRHLIDPAPLLKSRALIPAS